MKTVNLIQGSSEWHAHRANHFNASDAPAMLGVSKYKTRSQLLHEIATGLTKDVDAGTQKLFDNGHKFEALARPLAEKIIGEELSPTVGSEGKLSASFDGITFAGDVIWEHKTLNAELADLLGSGKPFTLPAMYRAQMEQQLMLSEAEKCLFMASKWNGNELVAEHHCWYYPDNEMRNALLQGWTQFAKDLEVYVTPIVKEKVVAEEVQSFPVPSIQVRGELVNCNLSTITPVFDKYLAETNTELVTDVDFANGEANAKNCRSAAKNLELTAEAVIGQITEISDAVSTLKLYATKFNALGLKLEKAVKEQKETIKTNAILKAKQDFFARVQELEAEIKPIRLIVETPNFSDAIKGLKTIDSMHTKIGQALTNGYLNAEAVARDIRNKLAWYNEYSKDHLALFADIQSVIYKENDDFELLVKSRIDAQIERNKKAEADLIEKLAEESRKNSAPKEEVKQEPEIVSESKPVSNYIKQAAVVEHQDDIARFLKSRGLSDSKYNEYRAVLVEFVKFTAKEEMAA